MSHKYPQPPDSLARSGDSNTDQMILYLALARGEKPYAWRESDMFVAHLDKPHNVVRNVMICGPTEPVPEVMFKKRPEREGRELWCAYRAGPKQHMRWMLYIPQTNSWGLKEPPAELKLAYMVST